MTREHLRPVLQSNSQLAWIPGSDDPATAHRLAQETSWALLDRVRSVADPEVVDRVVRLASGDGIDDIAELWSNASAYSLAGQLWRIYLLHRVAEGDPEGSVDLFRRGREEAVTIDPIVVGAPDPITPEAIGVLCTTILRGVFTGDLAIALERASSYARIMCLGAAALADDRELTDPEHASELTARALRYAQFSDELRFGARRWREGLLD